MKTIQKLIMHFLNEIILSLAYRNDKNSML